MASPRIEILFEDDDLLVVNKPAGVLSIPDRAGNVGVADLLRRGSTKEDGSSALRMVHRLDRDTSGVLVLAKHLDAQRAVSHQFQERTVVKHYLALVRGHADTAEGTIDAPIKPHPRDGQARMVGRGRGARDARTTWTLVEQYPGIALLRCRLHTGRQHQIRVHLAHVGLPLLVDELYGSDRPFFLSEVKPDYKPSRRHEERPLIARLTLHAESIAFTHPRRDEMLHLTADVPKDLRATITQLRKLSGTGLG